MPRVARLDSGVCFFDGVTGVTALYHCSSAPRTSGGPPHVCFSHPAEEDDSSGIVGRVCSFTGWSPARDGRHLRRKESPLAVLIRFAHAASASRYGGCLPSLLVAG